MRVWFGVASTSRVRLFRFPPVTALSPRAFTVLYSSIQGLFRLSHIFRVFSSPTHTTPIRKALTHGWPPLSRLRPRGKKKLFSEHPVCQRLSSTLSVEIRSLIRRIRSAGWIGFATKGKLCPCFWAAVSKSVVPACPENSKILQLGHFSLI